MNLNHGLSDSLIARLSFILSLHMFAFILGSWVVSHSKKNNVTFGQYKKGSRQVPCTVHLEQASYAHSSKKH